MWGPGTWTPPSRYPIPSGKRAPVPRTPPHQPPPPCRHLPPIPMRIPWCHVCSLELLCTRLDGGQDRTGEPDPVPTQWLRCGSPTRLGGKDSQRGWGLGGQTAQPGGFQRGEPSPAPPAHTCANIRPAPPKGSFVPRLASGPASAAAARPRAPGPSLFPPWPPTPTPGSQTAFFTVWWQLSGRDDGRPAGCCCGHGASPRGVSCPLFPCPSVRGSLQ